MKKIYISALMVLMAMFFTYCHSSKKAASAMPMTPAASAITYEKSVQPILVSACAPCHVPSKGGNKEALDSYSNAKKDVDDILRRVQLGPTDMGFMPMRHPKLSDADIATIKQWKDGGTVEK